MIRQTKNTNQRQGYSSPEPIETTETIESREMSLLHEGRDVERPIKRRGIFFFSLNEENETQGNGVSSWSMRVHLFNKLEPAT